MSAWKRIYLVFRRIAIPVALIASLIATAGCGDSTKSAMAKGALAQSQFDAGQLTAARKTIREAIEERDDIAELYLLRARIEMAAHSEDSAFNAYSSAVALDSANIEALVGVAQLGLQLGHVSESEDAADRVLALDPAQVNALVIKGLHNIIRHRLPDAISNADAVLAKSPNDEAASILKARALAMLDRPDDAFATIQNARKGVGETRGVAMTLLEIYRSQGKGVEMIPLLDQLRKQSPKDANLDIDEADTLYKLGDAQRARAILRSRMLNRKLNDVDANAVVNVWKEYDPQPLDPTALAEFSAKAGIPARKAMAYFYIGRDDPARAYAALAHAPAADDIVALRALVDVNQGKIDQSLAQAEAILARDHTHCDALVVKAQAEIAKRQAEDAIAASTLATTSCPKLIPGYLALSRAQELEGNKDGAMIAFRDAFDHNDQDQDLARRYTALLIQNGQSTRALAIARRLTNNAPALLSGWQLYADLCGRIPNAGCMPEAEAGLQDARLRFGVDPRTGEPTPKGLFGRIARK
jgi:tetratricopeptide (TPR) repeat protein